MVDFATTNILFIRPTMFEHKKTRISNDKVTWDHIIHILIVARHSSIILDVRSNRGLGADSYRVLLKAKVRIRIFSQKNVRLEVVPKWNIGVFEDPDERKEYQEDLEFTLRSIQNYENDEGIRGKMNL